MPLSGGGVTASVRPDEGRHHRESTASVRLKAQRLRRALDTDRLEDAVKIAADVAAELRSSAAAELSPKAYYDVYLSVCAELRLLEMYVMESARRGAPVRELYERVQETPLVLPRLYLLVTAGSVYVKSMQAPPKDVLRDLVEMCAGVQHPQRGLFLRAYLSQMMKDKLPHAAAVENGEEDAAKETGAVAGGTVQDSIDFVLRNFTEMNRLWVRMQHDCSPREMELREKERLELRLLVGSNIATLSRLVGSDLALYRGKVLHAILDQIVSCNDAIAQEYLADCVAQVFPDEFQLATLDAFMQMCGKLKKGVKMRTILVSIIDRLRRFSASSADAANTARDAHAFDVFRSEMPGVMRRQGTSLPLTDRLRIYSSLMSFALESEPERFEHVDNVLGFCVADMDKFLGGEHPKKDGISPRTAVRLSSASEGKDRSYSALSAEDERLAVNVLTMLLEAFGSVGSVLQLENYVVLQRFLSYDKQRALAAQLLMSAKGYTPCIEDEGTLEKLFKYVAPLVQDRRVDERGMSEKEGVEFERFDVTSLTHHHEYLLALIPQSHMSAVPGGKPEGGGTAAADDVQVSERYTIEEMATFQEDQELVAKIVYLCDDTDVERALSLYASLRQELLHGGPRRVPITLPSLILASLRLALRCQAEEKVEVVEDVLGFAGECVSLIPDSHALLALRLQLHVAATGASLGKHAWRFVYDNLSEAFVLFEQHITAAREQHTALELMIVSLGQTQRSLDGEAFAALSRRAVKHATQALTRSDQCVLLCLCAQLFDVEHAGLARECVDRARRAAVACMNAAERVLLLLDVSRTAVAVHEAGVCDVTEENRLADTLGKIRDILAGRAAKSSPLGKLAAARYQRLVRHLKSCSKVFEGLDYSRL
ncbi:unnamed protein product [Chondrus crispus]|uniref:Vacuolar protein sorting-associated protein 35 n=1 Tax=Chondrus crispus TaxID=2769 RepID=R7QT55_CHOCR|nr:unnamed protein product [Chondrus crispus]CDF40903.1 unnamed protein product [Chondrus crispus]|eukprot:XP_005711197.1 unnamed protein product [Chondrus crispus]